MTDLDCQEFVEVVTAFLDGALDAEGERRFVDHLVLCDGCDRYLDQVRQTVHALGGMEGVPAENLSAETRSALLDAFRTRTD